MFFSHISNIWGHILFDSVWFDIALRPFQWLRLCLEWSITQRQLRTILLFISITYLYRYKETIHHPYLTWFRIRIPRCGRSCRHWSRLWDDCVYYFSKIKTKLNNRKNNLLSFWINPKSCYCIIMTKFWKKVFIKINNDNVYFIHIFKSKILI